MLKTMRDTAEHIDDYAIDRGKNAHIARGSLEVGVVGDTVFQWIGYELNADTALTAAQRLFKAIRDAANLVPSEN